MILCQKVMGISDIDYIYLTKHIGDSDIKDVFDDDVRLLERLKRIISRDVIQTSLVYDDICKMCSGSDNITINGAIMSHCENMMNEDECHTILESDDDNEHSFRVINMEDDSNIVIIRLPTDEDACEPWSTGYIITQNQRDYLKILKVKYIKWAYNNFISSKIRLSSVEVMQNNKIISRNTVFMLGGAAVAVMLCNI
jgi:hypothetical protein